MTAPRGNGCRVFNSLADSEREFEKEIGNTHQPTHCPSLGSPVSEIYAGWSFETHVLSRERGWQGGEATTTRAERVKEECVVGPHGPRVEHATAQVAVKVSRCICGAASRLGTGSTQRLQQCC